MKQNTKWHDVDVVVDHLEDHDRARDDRLWWDDNLDQTMETLKVWPM
jgi:hypothetical protein